MLVTRARRQRGHALLEGALVLTLFVGFFLGTVDFTQFLYFRQSLVERVRVAARYASVHPTDPAGTKNMAVYNDAAGGTTATLPGLTTSMVDMTLESAGTPEARVTVTITGYPLRFFSFGLAGYGIPGPISATMLSEAP